MKVILKYHYLAVVLALFMLVLNQPVSGCQESVASSQSSVVGKSSDNIELLTTDDGRLTVDFRSPAYRVIIIDLGGLTIEEINSYPFYKLQEIIREGSIGLMNTSTAGPRNRENGFITIGSGIISRWGNTSPLIYPTSGLHNGEKAGNIYERLIGEVPYISGGVVLDIAQSYNRVRETQRRHWGRLGDILKENDLSYVVIGNSGYMELVQNQMALMFMDSTGRLPVVYFDTVNENGLGALGYFTDYDRIHTVFRNYPDASVIGIDLGDWNRLQLVQERVSTRLFQQTKNEIVHLKDLFLYNLVQGLNPDSDLLIMLSPSPTREQNRLRNLMVPVILWGKGVEPGILTSATTRREGIIANLDILPTILSTLNLDSRYHIVGRPAVSQATEHEALVRLVNMNQNMHFIYNTRPTLVRGYIFLQIIIIAIAIVMIFFIPRFLLYLKIPLLFLMSVPFGLLLVGLIPIISLFTYTVIVLSMAFALVAISLLMEQFLKTKNYNHVLSPFILIGLLTSLAILIDLSLGAPLMQRSTLGYDALAGARYYGLGNEYMGVLIGASIIGISGLLDKFRKNKYVLGVSSLYLLVTIYLIASPNWGSNLGGTIAAVMGFSYLIHQLYLEKVTIPQIAAAGMFASSFVLGLSVLDSMRDANLQSHFGRTATMVLTDGFQPLYEIIVRKIDMNIRLIRYTIWSRVFLLGMAALVIVFFKPIYLIQKLKDNFLQIYHGLFAVILASVIALLANDSGIVAAATMLIYAVAPLLYLGGLLYVSDKANPS